MWLSHHTPAYPVRIGAVCDMGVSISNDTCESISYFLLSLILLTAGQDLHEECFGAWECILISTVCCRLLQFGLLVHVYRHHLVGCCCAIGRHLWVLLLSPQPPSRRCFRGGFRATSSTTVLYLRGVSSWQHHHDGSCVGGIKNDNKQINVTWTLYMITWSLSIIIVRALICGVVWWGNVNITQMVYYVIILLYEGYDLTQLIADGNSVLGIQVIIYPYQSWISLPATSGLELARDLWITSGLNQEMWSTVLGDNTQDIGTDWDWLCFG